MLKTYTTLEEVPEALREHYKKENGRYVPALSDDHPVLVHNKQLVADKATDAARIKELEADVTAAGEKSIPRGHKAVPNADVEELAKFKLLGTAEEVTTKVNEHKTLKEKDSERTREDTLRKVAKAHNYNEDAFILLRDLPEFISRPSKDGKSTEWFAQLKDDKGVITEKPAKEFVESAEHIKPFMTSLTQRSEGVRVPPTGPTTQPAAGDPFAWAREYGKQHNESTKPAQDIYAAFNTARPA